MPACRLALRFLQLALGGSRTASALLGLQGGPPRCLLSQLALLLGAGALGVKGVRTNPSIVPGRSIPLAGGILPIATPGHTDGHCAFLLESAGILLTGDALVTLDPYTGRTGPRVVARAATAHSDEALDSLSLLAETGAHLVLPGHGAVWRDGGIAPAAAIARSRGVD